MKKIILEKLKAKFEGVSDSILDSQDTCRACVYGVQRQRLREGEAQSRIRKPELRADICSIVCRTKKFCRIHDFA